MRLWGKIKGTKRDYYIAEGNKAAGDEEAIDLGPDAEAKGTGVNTNIYWVTNSPLEEWTQLPELKPSDIINARGIKHTFSGELDA